MSNKTLTYVEIDIPAFDPVESPIGEETFRFAKDAEYLPDDIDAIPSIKDVQLTPTIISLGENLGQRATLTVTFKDHRHIFNGEDYSSGTFWGKFRARYGLKLRGRNVRLIRGRLGQTLAEMETRHFIIESTDGPSTNGEYKLIGKDTLKLADGDRAQAPTLSNGFLAAGIDADDTSATLSPSGISAEYPSSGYIAIGGKEICAYNLGGGDTMTLTRGQFNTPAQSHAAQDRCQLCVAYSGEDVADILYDLFVIFAGVDPSYIQLANWQAETDNFLGVVYTAVIAEPTSVNTLISELIEQAALAVWWDDVDQQIRMQVLRGIVTEADVFDQDNTLQGSLEVREQPEKRISQVYTYFGKINPLVKEDQLENYRSTALMIDSDAELEYGGAPVIKKIFSRWIPAGGRSVADRLNEIQIGRFRDPPRRFSFELFRYAGQDPALGGGYQLGGWPFQDVDGSSVQVPIQITRLNPEADRFEVEAEEMLFTGSEPDPTDRIIIFDSNINNVNLRSTHDSLYPDPVSGDVVTCIIQAGVIIGSVSTDIPAFDVGSWPSGVTVALHLAGRIQGRGGDGGQGGVAPGTSSDNGDPGLPGGTALYCRFAVTLDYLSGAAVWGGGGGGGGGGYNGAYGKPAGGGGAGAGKLPGNAGPGGSGGGNAGSSATESGGGGGAPSGGGTGGGNGGDPGNSGGSGGSVPSPFTGSGGSGGSAGPAIDGISFLSVSGSADVRGNQIN